MRRLKWIIPSLLFILVATLLYYFWNDTRDPYAAHPFSIKECDFTVDESMIPKFDEIQLDFTHEFDKGKSLPVMASCLIDIDNDGVDELFIGGGMGQKDALFQYVDGQMHNISDRVNLPEKKGNTLSATSYDLNQDGFSDLLVTRDSAVYVLYNKMGKFELNEIDVHLNEKSSPLSTTLGDINNDGFVDMFVAGYIRKDKMQGQTIFNDTTYGGSSVLLLNNGDNTFRDVTDSAGLNYIHNTFQAVFIDVNNDFQLDLVVAYDTGEPRIYLNKGGISFELKPNPHTGKFSYPMGIAVADYDNNQTPDLFFSNTGSSVPKMLAKGDLTEDQTLFTDWMLLKNDGKGAFVEAGKETNIADFEFSWGAIFEDFNLDGRQDLVVAENYIAFPPQALFKLPCRFLLQLQDGSFAATEQQAGVINKNFAITPLSSDFNGDGYPDLVYVNLNGPVKVFINKGGNSNYLKVTLPDRAAYIGCSVKVYSGTNIFTQYNIIGEGLCSDQSNTLIFGLANEQRIDSMLIYDIMGKVVVYDSIAINTTVIIE